MADDIATTSLFEDEIGDPITVPERTVESPTITYDKYTEIDLDTTDYVLLATPGRIYHVKNKSGNPVYIAFSKSGDTLTNSDDQQMMGGLTYEVTTPELEYTWVRASKAGSIISIRPNGTFDPTTDINSMGNALNGLVLRFDEHVESKNNPHEVTKDQVGLGNIPNAISLNYRENDPEVLATTSLTFKIYRQIWKHVNDRRNPHNVTKHQIELGNVDNYTTADYTKLEDCLSNVTDKFVTPAAAHRIAKMATAVAYSTKPQLIVASPLGDLPTDWMSNECDRPATHLERVDTNHVVVKAGLVVSYGTEHKVRISEPLLEDIVLPVSVDEDITYYVYVDIDPEGIIIGANLTKIPPLFDIERRNAVGDFFNITECEMYDMDDTPIRRVYTGRVLVNLGMVSTIIPLPLGDKYVFPLGSDLVLSGRYLLDNPFLSGQVSVKAEVVYNNGWQTTGWNDQIGVAAGVHPVQSDTLVVQCGQMGFLSCGRESGSLFGSAFTTVTSSLRTRIVVERGF